MTSTFSFQDARVEDVPVPGAINGEKKKAVVLDIQVEPAQAREVVNGYYADLLPAYLDEKQLEDLKFEVESADSDDPKGEKVHSAWKLVFDTEDLTPAEELSQQVADHVNGRPVFESSQTIGSSVAGYARTQGLLAILGSLICIIVYIGVRFKKLVFGFSATVALIHDVLIVLGFLAASKWLAPYLGVIGVNEFKIGLPTVVAFLTLIGYSLNDTIVLFDRMREISGKNVVINEGVVDSAINQCLSRTLLTSMTTLFVTLILYIFGGAGIHTFAFAMSLGVIVGTYSSLFIASPVLLWLLKSSAKKK